jgi:hypothetical protein
VRKPLLSLGGLVFLATCLVFLFTVTSSSHEEEFGARRVAVLTDWTTNHVLYPLYGRVDRMELAQRDPRAMFSWLRYGPNAPHPRLPRPPFRSSRGFDRDWSINLGTAGTAANMYPAKFTFDITAAPSCTDDYIVYPVNTAGSTSQPNLVAFNNLYSGTGAGGIGSCNRATPPADDDGTDATVLWSYNVSAIGGAVTTSPVLSWDVAGASPSVLGTKVAFVESAPGEIAHFHVLAWKAGDGQDTTDSDGLQNTLTPAQITTFVATDPVAGSGTATDLTLGIDPAGSDTLSAPYVDYTHDYAYVGDDDGNLYRIKDVFCPSYNTDPGCTEGLAPSLDTSWGTAGVVVVGGDCGVLTGAVDDSVTGNVFVGCSDGRIYGFTSTGAKLSPADLGLGDGSSFGGVVVPPIVDSSNGLVYAVTGTNDTSPVLLQANTAFGAAKKVALGTAPENAGNAGENISVPTFNTAYFSSTTSSNWAILSCGYDSTGSYTVLYAVGFNSSRVMSIVPPPLSNQFELATDVEACSPLTGFTNASTSIDWLFLGLSGGSLNNYDITSTTGSGFPSGFANTATMSESGGSSGIIPDNESTAAQASSIYFTGLTTQACGVGGSGYCAIKLTQAGLD